MVWIKKDQGEEKPSPLVVEKNVTSKQELNVTDKIERLKALKEEHNAIVDELLLVEKDIAEDISVPEKI